MGGQNSRAAEHRTIGLPCGEQAGRIVVGFAVVCKLQM